MSNINITTDFGKIKREHFQLSRFQTILSGTFLPTPGQNCGGH